jgi:photosystem II stability/assembly factor-like uncharacterized protein
MRLGGRSAGAAIAVLVVADLALIWLALRPADASKNATTSTRPASSRTATPSPDSRAAAPVAAADERVLLSVTGAGSGARAVSGSCKQGGAALSLRTTGGRWIPVQAPVTSLLRVTSLGADQAWAVGTDKGCVPRFLRTDDGGQTWDVQSSTADVWHLLPSADRAVHSPAGKVASPCRKAVAPTDLSVSGATSAAVLCATGVVRVTSDDGGTWRRAGNATGATAISFVDERIAYAAAPPTSGCDGATILASRNGGVSWTSVGCAPLGSTAVGLSFSSAQNGALASADTVLVTRDGGKTWSRDQRP